MKPLALRKLRVSLLALLLGLGALAPWARAEYIPIAVGDEWTMDMTIFSPAGHSSRAVFRRRIESADPKDGKDYVRERTWTLGLPKSKETTKLLRKDINGVYSIDESAPGGTEQTEIVFPLKPGASWRQTSSGKNITYTVVDLEEVDVSGKAYTNTYHIRAASDDGSYTEDFWEAPRVGNVKSVIAYPNGIKVTLEITDFKAGN
jgi:hypothetical protein